MSAAGDDAKRPSAPATATDAEIAGACDARFAAVREALRENVALRGELGAAVAVMVDGRRVVDLWCGWMDTGRSRPWRRDTLVNVFSVGKALTGVCALMLVSRGLLELDEPVAGRWPQFAAQDKQEVTVRQVLSHRAGLAAIAGEMPDGSLYDWDAVTSALAAQRPWWAPGTGHGYHVHTFGFLVGELVRRVTGETIGSFARREIADALGVEIGFGLPRGKRSRRAEYVFDASLRERSRRMTERSSEGPRSPVDPHLLERAYMNPPGATGIGTVNTETWQDAELPSANLHADARGIAGVYAALLAGTGSLVSADVLAAATTEESSGADLVLGRPSRFGLGFQLTQPERPLGPNGGSFGHFGAGGSLGFADPGAGVAFGYVMNRGGPQWQDPRNRALVDAVYRSLEE